MGMAELSSKHSVVEKRRPAKGTTGRGFQHPSRGQGQGRDTSKIVSDSVIEEERGRAHGMKGKGLLGYALC